MSGAIFFMRKRLWYGFQFVSGTHALATVLLALLNPGDTMVSAVGSPYDTMQSVIGITGDAPGNLKKRVSGIKKCRSKGMHMIWMPLPRRWMKM